jgi:beta-glucosidase/6-phospho-beta-glucosidase/beta-galactosidase
MRNQPSNRPRVANDYSFGIVYVDYPTLERIPKDSFDWYRDFIANRRPVGDPSLSGSRS